VAPIGLVVVLALGVSSAQAGRLTDSAGNPVVDNYGECWDAVGGSKAIMEACGDVIPVEPEPAMVEVVTTPTAKTVTTTIKQRVTIAAEMLFGFDSAELSEDAKTVIDERIQTLRGGVQLSSAMRVEGHTDSTGPEAYNMKLSQRRAQAVADYIVSESYNVTASDIEVVGMGESNPIASNATREGRAQNRRVVIEAQGIQEK
jgi:OOP family OmpA-OmpF porin